MNDYVQVMKGVRIVSLLAIAALLACASPAAAVLDTFWVEVDADGIVTTGGGSGFMLLGGDDVWFYHESSDWWDQWFYSDAFDPNRRNEIDLVFSIYRLDPDAGDAWAEVTLNWSTPAYSMAYGDSPTTPPLPPLTSTMSSIRSPEVNATSPIRARPSLNSNRTYLVS